MTPAGAFEYFGEAIPIMNELCKHPWRAEIVRITVSGGQDMPGIIIKIHADDMVATSRMLYEKCIMPAWQQIIFKPYYGDVT